MNLLHRQGLTLPELLVVIAILTLLLALVLPGVLKAREAANRLQCQKNLNQIGIALHNSHVAHGVLPPALRNREPYMFLSWQGRLLPYLEQGNLWLQTQDAFLQDWRFWAPPHRLPRTVVVAVFVCPTDGRTIGNPQPENIRAAYTHYLGVSGDSPGNGVFFLNSRVRLGEVQDGTSHTIMVGERPPSADERFGWWYAGIGQRNDGSVDCHLAARQVNETRRARSCPRGPFQYQDGSPANLCDMFHFWSLHPGGAHFLFADGSVRFLSYSARAVLPALATRAGGETPTFSD